MVKYGGRKRRHKNSKRQFCHCYNLVFSSSKLYTHIISLLTMISYFDNDFSWSEMESTGKAFDDLHNNHNNGSGDIEIRFDQKHNWEKFHSNHSTAEFFKPKRYLSQAFPEIVGRMRSPTSPTKKARTLLEVGSGAGAAVFPIMREVAIAVAVATEENVVVDVDVDQKYICVDISPKAIELLQSQPLYNPEFISSRVADVANLEDLDFIPDASVDVVLLVFVLSAVPPESFPIVFENVNRVLKPGGLVCFRDYGLYDMTMLRFKVGSRVVTSEQISRTFLRGDGTLSTFFDLATVDVLFAQINFSKVDANYACVENFNRKTKKTLRRVFLNSRFVKNL